MGDIYRTVNSTGVIILDEATWEKYKKSSHDYQNEKRKISSYISLDAKRLDDRKKRKSTGVRLRPEGLLFELDSDFVYPIVVIAKIKSNSNSNSFSEASLDNRVNNYAKNCMGCGTSGSMTPIQVDANKRMIQEEYKCGCCGLRMYL